MAAGPLLPISTPCPVESSSSDDKSSTEKKHAMTEFVIADLHDPNGIVFLHENAKNVQDDDAPSVCSTVSSDGSSSLYDEEAPPPPPRRVSFSEELISDVWERPYTLEQDREMLFYQSCDYQAFRKEYRAVLIKAAKARKQELKEQQRKERLACVKNWIVWASDVIKQESIFMSKVLSEPPRKPDTDVLVDTMFLY